MLRIGQVTNILQTLIFMSEFLLTTRTQSYVQEDVIAFKHFHLLKNVNTQKSLGFATKDHLEYRIPMYDGCMNFSEHTQEDSPLTHTFFI